MGCWNGTCFISNLPIMSGEPVVGYLVEYFSWKESQNRSGCCYPNDWANPFAMSFDGNYDDYGGIENINDNSIAIKYLLHLFKSSDPIELIKDIERDKRTITLERTEEENGVGLIMAHKSIVDSLILSHKPSQYDVDIDIVLSGLKDIRSFEQRKERLSDLLNEKGPSEIERGDLRQLLGFVSGPEQLGIHVDILERKDYSEMISFVVGLDNKDYDAEFAEIMKRDHIVKSYMHKLRKLWIGPSGKGSQSRYYSAHLKLAEAIKSHILESFDNPADENIKAE